MTSLTEINEFAIGNFKSSRFVKAAEDYCHVLKERAPHQWNQDSILKETIQEMKDIGFFQMMQPKMWGGHECMPIETFEVTARLAEVDASVAWVLGVLSIHSFHLAMFSQEAQAEVWSKNSSSLISSPYAPGLAKKVPGGYKLYGRWSFSSGGEHCDWTFLGANIEGDTTNTRPPGMASHTMLLPRKDYEIIKNWSVHGLRATGSNDVVVDGAFVPEHRALAWSEIENGTAPGLVENKSVLYKIPFFQIFSRSTPTPCAIGALKGMANEFILAQQQRQNKQVIDPAVSLAVARALNGVDELKGAVYRNYALLIKEAMGGDVVGIDDRRKFRFQAAQIPQRCTELASELYRVAGGSGISTNKPFGRIINDIYAIQTHRLNNYQPHANAWIGTLMGYQDAAKNFVA